MNRILPLLLLTTLPLAAQDTNALTRAHIRNLLREASETYATPQPESANNAAQRFGAVADLDDPREYNLDALRLAQGMALLKAGDAPAALQALDKVKGFDHSTERSRLRLLRGNAHFHLAEKSAADEKWDEALGAIAKAVENYTQALIETPDSPDARHNLELAHRRRQDFERLKPPPPTPTPTPSPTPTPDPQASPTPTPDPQASPTPTPDPQASPTPTPDPQASPTPDPNATPEPQDTGEPQEPQDTQSGEPSSLGEPSEEERNAQEAARILDAFLQQERNQRDQILKRNLRILPVEKDW